MISYNPADWYWIVAGSTTQVWSSARVQYVGVDDSTYQAWRVAGGVPTKIDSQDSLITVLRQQYPAGVPPSSVTLDSRLAELAALRYQKQTLGVLYKPSGSTTHYMFPTDDASRANVGAAQQLVAASVYPSSAPWKIADGTFVSMTGADITALGTKIGAYVLACFTNEQTLSTALAASLTTDITVGWPSQL